MYKNNKNLAEHEVTFNKTENTPEPEWERIIIKADESGNMIRTVIKEEEEAAPEEVEGSPLHPKSIKRDILKESQKSENPEPVILTAGQKFFIAMDKFGDFFILNMMLVVFCLPIITIGASLTALYSVFIKMVKNEEGVAKNDFLKAFKKNFKAATKVWAVILIVGATLFLQYAYIKNHDDTLASYLMIFLGFEMLIVSLVVPMIFPLVARYENTTFNYIKNSFIISLMNIKQWLMVFFHFFVPFLIYYVNPKIRHYTWYLWLVILFSIFAYSKTVVMWKIFDKLEKKPEN
ncbi:MAG: DUF624 domain-containing protein [Eubacterium sp.]|nr:DUF624 domain-containing protein [Eubacterium sp.]